MATIETELIETKRDERGRQIRTTTEREALVKAYQSSGLTQRAFADREGIKYTTFVAWVQDAKRAAPKTSGGFTELTLPGRPAAPLEVQLADGTLVRGGNAEEIARLIQLIRC